MVRMSNMFRYINCTGPLKAVGVAAYRNVVWKMMNKKKKYAGQQESLGAIKEQTKGKEGGREN